MTDNDPKMDKAQAAIELENLCREWKERKKLSNAGAAEKLGIPKKTFDNILQGRGFPYPQLLKIALRHYK